MYNKFFLIFLSFLVMFVFVACKAQNNTINNKRYQMNKSTWFYDKEFDDIDKAIVEIANQLLLNISNNNHINQKVAITSLVSLDDLNHSSTFGRMLSESLFNELHERKFKVVDLRATDMVTVNASGEFVLTRDIDKLKDEITESVTLVGTYSPIDENRIVINTRILNIFTLDVLSTSRIIYVHNDDCMTLDLCPSQKNQQKTNLIPIKSSISGSDYNINKESRKIYKMDNK